MGIDRARLFATVRELRLPDGEYAVFGSGPLIVRDLREGNDIDLVVTPGLYERLKADVAWWVARKDDGGEVLRHEGDVEAMRRLEFPTYSGDIEALIAGAERIDGVPFVSLPDTRAFKAALQRPKDQVDLDLIDQALADSASFTDRVARARALLADGESPAERRPTAWREFGLAYALLLVAAALRALGGLLHGGGVLELVLAPATAVVGLGLAVIVGGVAQATATASGEATLPVSGRTGVLMGLAALPHAVTVLVTDSTAGTYVAAGTTPFLLAALAGLYARSSRVSLGRGLLGAVAGLLIAVAVVILFGFVAVLVSSPN